MYKALNCAIIALGVGGACVAAAGPASAQIGISLDVGSIAFGYQDGYWDRDHHWHHWRSRHEANYYRNSPGNHYRSYRHDRNGSDGWQRMNDAAIDGSLGLSVNVGDVAFGYQDGYWDRGHQWHAWRNDREMREYRNAPGNQYSDWRHDRDGDQGWRSVAFNVGDVASGYQDGYWDRSHQWHPWRSDQEMRDYRNAPGNQYSDWRHDRDSDQNGHGLTINVGDVAFGYQDGYWDRSHQWHAWRNEQEMRDYRNSPGNQYSDWRHDRDSDQGWRGLTINVGDVAFGYQDGYWDHAHQWHQWRNEQEMRDYRNAPGSQYNDYRHDRDNDQGWRR